MRLPTLLLLFVLTGILAFAAANWAVIVAPTTVSLLVADIQAPLGLIMFGLTVLVTVLFLIFAAYLQTTVLLDARRHSRELQAQRELADKAEASRFTDLRMYLDAELRKLGEQLAESRVGVTARIDLAQQDLRTAIEESGNSLAAHIGELEDRLERGEVNKYRRDQTSLPSVTFLTGKGSGRGGVSNPVQARSGWRVCHCVACS